MSIKIDLGMMVWDYENGGEISNIPLRYFMYNLLITGKNRAERNATLSYILNQLYVRLPDIGVLFIKLKSNEDLYLYHLDKVYKYGDSDLVIPYFIKEQFDARNREQFEEYINAIFGFHPEMTIVMGCLLHHYKTGEFPSSLVDLLEDLKTNLIEHPYSDNFTESNIRSIEKAIHLFENDPVLERTLEILLEVPEWLKLWSEGKAICIDLSGCDLFYQKVLVTFLLQTIKNLIPIRNSDVFRGIIVLEDADKILKKPPHEDYRKNFIMNRDYFRRIEEENYFLTKEQLEGVYGDKEYLFNIQLERMFEDLICDEFRYRNISLITVCEDLSEIYYYYKDSSQIKINLD